MVQIEYSKNENEIKAFAIRSVYVITTLNETIDLTTLKKLDFSKNVFFFQTNPVYPCISLFYIEIYGFVKLSKCQVLANILFLI